MDWTSYYRTLGIYGSTRKERLVSQAKRDLIRNKDSSPSCHTVLLNGCEHDALVISSKGNDNEKNLVMMPEDKIFVGEYVEWDGKTWLITSVNHDHTISYSGKITLCDLELKWQDENGEIISKLCAISGTGGSNTSYSQQASRVDGIYYVKIPCDNDTKNITTNKRFIVWNKGAVPEVCKLVNINAVELTSLDGDSGILSWTFEKDLFNESSDNREKMIADYVEPSKPSGIEIVLSCDKQEVVIGGSPRLIVSNISNGTWELITAPEMEMLFEIKTEKEKCWVSAKEDYSLLGSSVMIRCSIGNNSTDLMLKVVSRI